MGIKGPEVSKHLHAKLDPACFVRTKCGLKLLAEHADKARQVLGARDAKVDTVAAGSSPYATHRAERERHLARKAELEVKRLESELLPMDAVVKWYTEAVSRTSRRILQVPRQLCAVLVGQDAGQIEKLLEDELRGALRELRGELEGVEMVQDREQPASAGNGAMHA